MSAETAADPDLDPPDDPATRIVVCAGGPSHVYHRLAEGEDGPEPACFTAGEERAEWRAAELRQYPARRPCRVCWSDGHSGGDVGRDGPRPCPLCGARNVNLIAHLASPDGEGCPYTPMTGGNSR